VCWLKKLAIIKLGGSAITVKDKFKEPREEIIKQAGQEIAEAIKTEGYRVILVHGGGSFGHPVAHKYGLKEGLKTLESKIGFSETIDAMRELNLIVSRILRELNLPIMPIQPSAISLMDNDKLISMHLDVILRALDEGFIPLLWGDPVLDLTKGCTILSGDDIIHYLAKVIKPKVVVFGTNVDGVFLDFPKNQELVHKIDESNLREVLEAIRPVSYRDVTGGFYRKMNRIIDISKQGIRVYIVNLFKKGRLLKALMMKDDAGTLIEVK